MQGKELLSKMFRNYFVLVYIFANIISWTLDSVSARALTRELAEFQNKHDT